MTSLAIGNAAIPRNVLQSAARAVAFPSLEFLLYHDIYAWNAKSIKERQIYVHHAFLTLLFSTITRGFA